MLQHAQITIELEFLHPVRRGTVDKASAFGIGHKLGGAEVADVVPFAFATLGTGERVGQLDILQLIGGHIAKAGPLIIVQTGATQHVSGQIVGKKELVTHVGPAFVRHTGNFVEAIRDVLTVHDCLVRRHGPRSRRPDHHVGTF